MKNSPEQIHQSALSAIKSILAMKDVLEVHKKELLSDMVWKITERFGKFNAEYVSKEAKKILDSNKTTKEKLRLLAHEHVYTRKYLMQKLLSKPNDYKNILKEAIGCVVTREEHKILSSIKDCEGWDRYIKSKVTYEKNSKTLR